MPELLRSMLGSGETGVLTFRNGDVTKSVFMHMGRVVYARSNNPDERLGESLLVRGKITVRQYLEASQLIRPGPAARRDPRWSWRRSSRGPAARGRAARARRSCSTSSPGRAASTSSS